MFDISRYKTIIFDCDGVVLNSNQVKTQAFYEASKHYGEGPAKALVNYHVQNGGVSRYVKFEYFLTNIMEQSIDQTVLEDLLQRFAVAVKKGLLACKIAEGIEDLRHKTHKSNWLIISGGDQKELREVFSIRVLDKLFQGGIFGSPDKKETIIKREIKAGNIVKPCLFIGDSKYDYEAAKNAELDFVFLSDWTEVKDYKNWTADNFLDSYENIKSLL